jgi:hypothetical protein
MVAIACPQTLERVHAAKKKASAAADLWQNEMSSSQNRVGSQWPVTAISRHALDY